MRRAVCAVRFNLCAARHFYNRSQCSLALRAAMPPSAARRLRRRLQHNRRVATPLKAHTARRTAHSYSTHVARS